MKSGKVLNQEELFLLVKQEAENLKIHATPEELNKLDIDELNDSSTQRCVYGLLTGDCFSGRSEELIQKCCERVMRPAYAIRHSLELNGSPLKTERNNYWSPIEVYISQFSYYLNGNNASLVAFLRSETDTLTFTPTEIL